MLTKYGQNVSEYKTNYGQNWIRRTIEEMNVFPLRFLYSMLIGRRRKSPASGVSKCLAKAPKELVVYHMVCNCRALNLLVA